MSDIELKKTELEDALTFLGQVITEFNDASDTNDGLEDAVGKPDGRDELRDKVHDFEGDWNDRRETLAENLTAIRDQLTAIVDGWEEWDRETGSDAPVPAGGTETRN